MIQNDSTATDLSTVDRMVAASVAGMVTALVMTPLDVVKIRMQANRKLPSSNCFIYCNGLMEHLCTCTSNLSASPDVPWYRKPGRFTSTWVGFGAHRRTKYSPTCIYHSGVQPITICSPHILRTGDTFYKIVRNEGVLSLWSGLSPTLIMALPQTVIYYTLNDWLKHRIGYYANERNRGLQNHGHKQFSMNDWSPALVGGFSRIFAVAAISPIELLRTKMQAKKLTLDALVRVLSGSVKQDGLSSLWTGMGPTLLRDVPYSMAFWAIFEYLKSRHLVQQLSGLELFSDEQPKLPFYRTLAYGALAGLTAGLITHPFDVIKTHRQIELGEAIVTGRAYPKSTIKSIRRLYDVNGIQAVFSGFTPRLVKTTVASAIMLTTFECLKNQLSKSDGCRISTVT